MKLTRRSASLLLILYAILIGAWAWRFMPHTQLDTAPITAEQEMREKLASWLAVAPQDTALPALMSLAGLPTDQLKTLFSWLQLSPTNQIRQLTVQQAPIANLGHEWNAALLQTLLIHSPPMDLREAHQMIAAAGERLTDPQKQAALDSLARRAQAQGDMTDAVTILGRACELPGATWKTLQQLTAAARAARHTPPALRAVSLWIKRHESDVSEDALEEAKDVEFSLMMEADNTAEALSQQLADLAGVTPYSERTLDRAWLAARRLHQGSRLLPYLERHLDSFAEHTLSLEKLSLQLDLAPNYLRWLACYASVCDDEQPKSLAFTAYQRLAAARVATALPRLCALAATPAQAQQAEQMLSTALEQPELQSTVLQLAQSQPIARKVLTQQLRQHPKERDLHYAATAAAAAAQTHGSTAMLWQDFLRAFPNDVSALRRLIQAHLQDRQPAMALRTYSRLPPQALTLEDRDQMALLQQL